jgi:outer membrane protein
MNRYGGLNTRPGQHWAPPNPDHVSGVALNGVREEGRVGQRTTVDVLNVRQALVNAPVALVTAQHDPLMAWRPTTFRRGLALSSSSRFAHL